MTINKCGWNYQKRAKFTVGLTLARVTMEGNHEEEKIIHDDRKPCCFFKLILFPNSQSKKLRIPEIFARAFHEELSAVAILRVPTGETRKVALVEEGNNLWFHDGWQDFVECYSIGYASFLLFKYDGNSNFRVHIFDPSACEISYQCNARNSFKPQLGTCPEEIDDDAEDRREILHSSSADVKISDSEEIIELDSDDETSDARECSPFGYLENKQGIMNAVAAAGIPLPDRPYFVTDIKTYVLHRGLYLNVPASFCHDHLKCNVMQSKFIKLVAYGGKHVTVKCIRSQSRCTFGSGWIIFARGAGLEVGDVCIFELTDAINYVLHVHIAKKSQIKAAA